MNLSFCGDRIGKLHGLTAAFHMLVFLHLLFTLISGIAMPWVFFPPFKREMSAGRIKIGRLGMISLYAHPPASCDTFCFEVFSIVSLFHEFWLRDFLPRLLFWKEVGPFLSHGA